MPHDAIPDSRLRVGLPTDPSFPSTVVTYRVMDGHGYLRILECQLTEDGPLWYCSSFDFKARRWRAQKIGPALSFEDQCAIAAASSSGRTLQKKKSQDQRFTINQRVFDAYKRRFGLQADEAKVNAGPHGVQVLIGTPKAFVKRLEALADDPATNERVRSAARRSLSKINRRLNPNSATANYVPHD